MKSQFHLKATPVAYGSQRVKLLPTGCIGLKLTKTSKVLLSADKHHPLVSIATMDYTGILSQSLVLNDTTTYIDVVVSIVNDSTLESMEQFFADLVIASTETRGVTLDPKEATINIRDEDGAWV